MQNAYDLWANPWTYFVIVGLFVWLIPLWHSLRSGSVLAVIEVLMLLAFGVALPILVFAFAAALGEFVSLFGALGAIQAIAGSSLLWFAALVWPPTLAGNSDAASDGRVMRPCLTILGTYRESSLDRLGETRQFGGTRQPPMETIEIEVDNGCRV
jgi:hypothetical protein